MDVDHNNAGWLAALLLGVWSLLSGLVNRIFWRQIKRIDELEEAQRNSIDRSEMQNEMDKFMRNVMGHMNLLRDEVKEGNKQTREDISNLTNAMINKQNKG